MREHKNNRTKIKGKENKRKEKEIDIPSNPDSLVPSSSDF